MKTDIVYRNWISDITERFHRSQVKAAMRDNSEMLRFYWSLGKDIASMSLEAGYGSEFYKTISEDLKRELPGVHSSSPANLKYMRYFYEMYPEAENRQQAVDDLGMMIIFFIPLVSLFKENPRDYQIAGTEVHVDIFNDRLKQHCGALTKGKLYEYWGSQLEQ